MFPSGELLVISAERTRDLEGLSFRLERQSFGVRPRPYFGEPGVVAFVVDAAVGTWTVMENAAFLHATREGWCARITPHGGRHWTRKAADISALECIALEAIQRAEVPPSPAWVEE